MRVVRLSVILHQRSRLSSGTQQCRLSLQSRLNCVQLIQAQSGTPLPVLRHVLVLRHGHVHLCKECLLDTHGPDRVARLNTIGDSARSYSDRMRWIRSAALFRAPALPRLYSRSLPLHGILAANLARFPAALTESQPCVDRQPALCRPHPCVSQRFIIFVMLVY